MDIRYWQPLERAWQRAKSMLFDPFNLEAWFVIGFTVWLARLWDGSLWGGDGGLRWEMDGDDHNIGGLLGSGIERAADAFSHPIQFFVAAMLLALIIVVGAVLAWVGSRGAFMFFDNVAWRRGRVSDPWQRLGPLGDSLFLWRVGTQLLAGLFAVALVLPAVILLGGAAAAGGVFAGVGIAGALLAGLAGVLLGLIVAFVGFCTDQFVVPLMHRYDEGVIAAWERFLPLLREHPLPFVLMSLAYLGVWIVVTAAIAAAGAMTCCALFLVLAIPYVGTVVLLPVHATLRGFGPEFLAQFGDDYRTWPEEEIHDTSDADDGFVEAEAEPLEDAEPVEDPDPQPDDDDQRP